MKLDPCATVVETKYENVTRNECDLELQVTKLSLSRLHDAFVHLWGVVPQEPLCSAAVRENCGTVCETVEEVVSVPIETNRCVQKIEAVCQEVSAELCVVPEEEHQFCPIVPAFEGERVRPRARIGTPSFGVTLSLFLASRCKGQPPSDCWSPGTTDVDCEGYGLCCFDGCFNRCLKDDRCQNVTRTECVEEPSESCEGSQTAETRCFTIQLPIFK